MAIWFTIKQNTFFPLAWFLKCWIMKWIFFLPWSKLYYNHKHVAIFFVYILISEENFVYNLQSSLEVA